MVKRLQRVTPQQTPEEPSEPTGSPKPASLPNVREQVPGWLKTLLGKYGETGGRLVGLEVDPVKEEHIGPPPPTTEEEGQLSNLLEQMAETGIDPAAGQDEFSSVEWGEPAPAAEESAGALDDLLAGMGTASEDTYEDQTAAAEEIPDWLTDTTPAAEPTPNIQQPAPSAPPTPAADDEVPDWLTDALDEPAVPQQPAATPTPPPVESSVSDDEVPDWLTDALDEPAAPPPEQTPPVPPAPAADEEVPDWLAPDAATTDPAPPAWQDQPAQAEAGQADAEIPDWLGGVDTPADAALAPDDTDYQVPDWITEGMDDLAAPEPAQEPSTVEPDAPDWLASEQPPVAETTDTPDWLADDTPPPTEAAPSPAAVPDWLAEPETSTQPDTGDAGAAGDEAIDWLFDTSDMPEQTAETDYVGQPVESFPPEPAQPAVEVPPWLGNIQAEASPASPPMQTPEWLQNLETTTESSAPVSNESPEWLDNLQREPAEREAPSETDSDTGAEGLAATTTAAAGVAAAAIDGESDEDKPKLKRIKPLKRLQPKEETGTVEAEDTGAPEWVSDLAPDSAETGQEDTTPPEWTEELIPSQAAPTETTDTTLPDWADDLVPPDARESESPPPPEEPIAQPDLTMPAGLSAPPEPETSAVEEEQDATDWMAGLRADIVTEEPTPTPEGSSPEAVEETPDIEIPDWLGGDTPPATEEPEQVTATTTDMPDWLSETTPAEETPAAVAEPIESEAEPQIPDWLAEQAPTEETPAAIAESEAELEMPDWLSETAAADETPTAAEPTEPEIEAELPDWLAEQAPTEETSAAVAESTEPEAELEIPDWLSETTPAEETPAATTEMAEPEVEAEIPDWLAEQAPTEIVEPIVEDEVQPEPVIEAELPDWMSELPEQADEPEASEMAAEIPDWLAEQAPGDETPSPLEEGQPAPETEPGVEPTTEAVEPMAEAVDSTADMPDWLSELPEAEQSDTVSAEPATIEPAADIPDWLAEQAPVEQMPAPSTESTEPTIEEGELPDWLSELPEAEPEQPGESIVEAAQAVEPTTEAVEPTADMPDWLAEQMQGEETPVEGDSQPAPEIEDVSEPIAESPEWSAEQASVADIAEPAETVEPTADMPDWLSELPEAETETEPVATELPADIPDWLAEQAPVEQTPAPSAEAPEPTIEEGELPDWLSELPEAEPEQPGESIVEAAQAVEPTSDLPDWLAEQMPTEEPSAPVSEPAPEIEQVVEPTVDVPDQMAEPPVADETPVETVEEIEMPAWLSELPEDEADQPAEVSAELDAETPEPAAEIPDWLAEQAPAEETPVPSAATAEPTIEEAELPDWISELPQSELEQPETPPPAWDDAETEPETPIDFAIEEPKPNTSELFQEEFDESEPPLPPWLSTGEGDTDSTAEEPPASDEAATILSSESRGRRTGLTGLLSWVSDDDESPADSESSSAGEASEELIDDAELPDWLAPTEDSPGVDESSESDWLSGIREASKAVEEALPPEEDADAPPPPPPSTDRPDQADRNDEEKKTNLDEPKASLASSPPDSTPSSPSAEKSAGWMQALKPSRTAEAVMDAEQSPSAESTGMLAGLTGLLPAEKMVTTTPTLDPQTANGNGTDAVLEAAQSFYAIATQAPQPATLPAPATQPDKKQFPQNLIRAGVFVLFILLVAIPLLPGFQKAADPETGRQTPWTEPGGELNDTLSSRRSQLIGNELGIIDLQQPDSVALVSFDYSAGTQGEMQPLAEAILGRLRGQGMRVILMSLEPEGAALAQTVLDKRDEPYGENVVNLGYMPGQMMAVRTLASGQKQLSTVADYQEGLTFRDDRANWQDIENLQQVDVIVTLADNPATARWWIEQMQMAAPTDSGEQYLLGATSAVTEPFLQPYRNAGQLDGLITGINGAAAIEAGRREFGPARQMLDSQSLAHLLIIILIAAGTIAGWMPKTATESNSGSEEE